jgi:hypothetical protein
MGLPWAFQIQVSSSYSRTAATTGSFSGFDDFSLDVSKQLLSEGDHAPTLVADFGVSIPIGNAPNANSQTTSGFGTVFGSLIASKQVDPLVFFGGVFVEKAAFDRPSNFPFDPAIAVGLRSGGVLALSPQMSLSGAFTFWRQGAYRFNSVEVPGSDVTSGSFSLGLSRVLSPSLMVTGTAAMRILGPQPDFGLSIAFPYRF